MYASPGAKASAKETRLDNDKPDKINDKSKGKSKSTYGQIYSGKSSGSNDKDKIQMTRLLDVKPRRLISKVRRK